MPNEMSKAARWGAIAAIATALGTVLVAYLNRTPTPPQPQNPIVAPKPPPSNPGTPAKLDPPKQQKKITITYATYSFLPTSCDENTVKDSLKFCNGEVECNDITVGMERCPHKADFAPGLKKQLEVRWNCSDLVQDPIRKVDGEVFSLSCVGK